MGDESVFFQGHDGIGRRGMFGKYKRYSERRDDELSFTWITILATCFRLE
jgi:hypothetical protein